jgi:hypothetical protein
MLVNKLTKEFIKAKIKSKIFLSIPKKNDLIYRAIVKIQEALGRIENRQLRMFNSYDLYANEFSAFSQWGEDRIIQFLLKNIRKLSVEEGYMPT